MEITAANSVAEIASVRDQSNNEEFSSPGICVPQGSRNLGVKTKPYNNGHFYSLTSGLKLKLLEKRWFRHNPFPVDDLFFTL